MIGKGLQVLRVSLFITCLADSLFPEVGESVVRILHRLGCQVDFPEGQTCCGQPAYNSGYLRETRDVAVTLLDAFEESEYVVTPSGSCAGMIGHGYPDLFADDPVLLSRAQRLAKKTYEFSQFLVDVLGVTDLGAELNARVTYHPSCHAMRLMGVKDQPETLLRHVKGLTYVELPNKTECCGFGGTFSVKMGEISAAMVSDKVNHVLQTRAEILTGTDMGCLMNIQGRLRREGHEVEVMHLAQLLAKGMGL
jgi:L-lactate dehydrogenase complex protein LldE